MVLIDICFASELIRENIYPDLKSTHKFHKMQE